MHQWIAQSKTHENEVLHLFLASFIEISYLPLKLTFDLEKCSNCSSWHSSDLTDND